MGAGGLTRLRSFDALLTQAPVAWTRYRLRLTRIRSDMLRLSSCANSHSAACLTRCRSLVLLAFARASSDYRPAAHILRMRTLGRYRSLLLADARLCSDYRPALTAIRLLVYGSRKPDSANDSIAPTITNAPVSAQATTPTEDSLCKGE